MNITATSEATAQEVLKEMTYYSASHTVWYAVRLVCWIGANSENERVLYYKWQKGDCGWHAYVNIRCDYTVYYNGTSSTVNFALGTSTTGWTDCCPMQSIAASSDSGTIRGTGRRFVTTTYDTRPTFDISESITIGEVDIPEDPYDPSHRVDGVACRYFLYADGEIIYSPFLIDKQILDPELSEEVNQVSVIKFKIPYNHPAYSEGRFSKYKTTITLKEGGEVIFIGRVSRVTKSMDMCLSVEAQGGLSYLSDTEYAPFKYDGEAIELFRRVIESHNGQTSRKLVFKSTPYDARYRVQLEEKKHSISIDVISSILKDSEAYIDITHDQNGTIYISLVTNFARNSAQRLAYGHNILSLEVDDSDEEGYCNAVRATSGDLVTGIIEDANAIEFAGSRIIKHIDFNDVENMNELNRLANEYLAKHCVMKKTLTATAVDLNLIDKNQQKFRLGDMVEVYMPVLNITGWYLIRKRKIVINDPGSNEYEIGDATFGITDEVSIVNRRRWSRSSIDDNQNTTIEISDGNNT